MQPKQTFDKKLSFLRKAEERLSKIAAKIQRKIWKGVRPIIESLDDKVSVDDSRAIQKIENTAFKIYKEETGLITTQVITDFERINKFNNDYYSAYVSKLDERFKAGKELSELLLKQRLGLVGTQLAADGFLNAFRNNPEVLQRIRQETLRAITGTVAKETLTSRISNLILETDTGGIVQGQVSRFVADSYSEFDSVTQTIRAGRLGMRVAYYANSLIADSRCFCRTRFNKVFTVEEISKWKASTKPSNHKGANCKAIYPSGRYNPLSHRGGYNCRHVWRWLPKASALRFRPDLKEYYEDLDARGIKYL